ncbi:MAG TPA: TonB-dependent receptor, partial [Gemmatimonadaceae bacterium]|nr:TonB-dependent receptor [Gemmatimonadaceae bacterium]
MNPRRLFILLAVFLAGIAALPRTASAQQADVIRGRVIGPDSLPVPEVLVTVTSFSGSVSRTARTDRNGRFTVTFPSGDGDYMVAFAAIGYAAKRFEVKRMADEEILVADAKLTKVDAVLGAMEIKAPRDKVARNDPAPDISGTERPIPTTDVPANLMGDLAAMAASLPGVQTVPGEGGDPNGFSVLGLGADQNNTTLNGMSFGGSGLPRDAAISSSLVTTPYDVSRGGFSGAQMSIRTRPGSNFITRGMSLNLDAPQTQWTDAAARALGQEYTNASLGGAVSGPISFDRTFFNLSWQLGRRANDYQNLLDTDPIGLKAAGVAYDSVGRFLNILGGQAVPSSVGGVTSDKLSDQGTLFGAIDFAPPGSTRGSAYNLSFNGGWNKQRPVFGSVTSLPASDGERTGWRGGLQGRHTTYFGVGILSETSLGLQWSRNYADPYLSLPGGRVRVNSLFDDGTNGVQTLAFGGNQSLSNTSTNTGFQATNQLSWFSTNNKHRLKLTTDLRYDGITQDQTNNLLGTFSYNSLSDLAAGRPATFTRQLTRRERDAGQLLAGLSLGDSWRKSSNFQVQYGVRVDGNMFLDDPSLNPQV